MADQRAITQVTPSSSGTSISSILEGSQTLGAQNSIDNGIQPVSGVMRFPTDLESFDYWLSFSFYEYRRPTFAGNPILADAGTIKLPLPNNLRDDQSVDYNTSELSAAVGAGLNELSGGRTSGSLSDVATAATKSVASAAGGALLGGLNNLAPNLVAGAGQLAGVAVNPWTTIMFKGPHYRQSQFTWILTPSNEKESGMIMDMINTFKFNMLPDTSGAIGGTLLTYPNICQITARNGKTRNWNYLFKPAVITALNVNYAAAGQPSFFGVSRAPTAIEIRINFQEIEFFLQRDYGTPNNAGQPLINAASGFGGAAAATAALGFAATQAFKLGRRLSGR
jgi:hypothetical protein